MVDNIGPCLFDSKILNAFKRKKPLDKMPSGVLKGRSWKNIDPDDLPTRFRKIHDDPVKYRAPNFYRRFALGEINGTITASAQPENCGITHPGENRRFSIREAARIQSFPDEFNFETKHPSLGYKVIGNAVPPIFGWVLAKGLLSHLNG
jgi:DNA (cytosine-5)-methyltransferase 1